MVKMPGLDDLKKMGSGLIDSAKSVKFGEVMDKVKSGIDSVSGKKGSVEITDETLKNAFQGVFATLTELAQAQAVQVAALKKAEKQLEALANIVETYQKSAAPPVASETNKEETKSHE